MADNQSILERIWKSKGRYSGASTGLKQNSRELPTSSCMGPCSGKWTVHSQAADRHQHMGCQLRPTTGKHLNNAGLQGCRLPSELLPAVVWHCRTYGCCVQVFRLQSASCCCALHGEGQLLLPVDAAPYRRQPTPRRGLLGAHLKFPGSPRMMLALQLRGGARKASSSSSMRKSAASSQALPALPSVPTPALLPCQRAGALASPTAQSGCMAAPPHQTQPGWAPAQCDCCCRPAPRTW